MMFLSLLAASAFALAPIQQPKSLYQQVIEQPNPYNGYDDYVRAADIVRASGAAPHMDWGPAMLESLVALKKEAVSSPSTASDWNEDMERQLTEARKRHELGYLGNMRTAVQLAEKALALVRAGNEKRVWDPRQKLDATTLFPELAEFKRLAKLFRASAYAHFAEGDTKAGTSDLLEGLTFARKIAGGNLICALVSIASTSIVLAGFDENLSALSEKDVQTIGKYTDAALQEPNSYLEALDREKHLAIANIDYVLQNPRDFMSTEDVGMTTAFLLKMTPREKETARAGLTKAVKEFYQKLTDRLSQNESTWANAQDQDDLPPMPQQVESVQELVDSLVHDLLPIHQQATLALLKSRAQLRLLGLHARIISHRWHTGQLPSELKDIVAEQMLFDPMGKEAFHYELLGQHYKLYSKGVASTGPIELKYRRAPNPKIDDNPIPPLRSLRW